MTREAADSPDITVTMSDQERDGSPPRREDTGEDRNGDDKPRESSRDRGSRKSRSRDRDKKKKKKRRRSRSRSKERSRRSGRDRDRDRDKDKDKDREGKDREDKDREGGEDRGRDRDRRRRRSRSKSPRSPSPATKEKERLKKEAEEEREKNRDDYTVFISQIHPKVDERDLFEFFSHVGRVEDIRLIRDQRTQKSKGLCYVEFWEKDSVHKAVALTGQIIGGHPINVQVCQSQKIAEEAAKASAMKLYVGSLHFNVTENDLQPVFEAFGALDFIDLHKDPVTGTSKGFGFVQYKKQEDAIAALQALDGLEIAGRPIKVGTVDGDNNPMVAGTAEEKMGKLEDEDGGGGLSMTSGGRAALMAQLSRGQSFGVPAGLGAPAILAAPKAAVPMLPVLVQPTTCLVVKNMFDPKTETEPDFDLDIKEDVEEECEKMGSKPRHAFVDKNSQGQVFLSFQSSAHAQTVVAAFHGRWFASRQISAEYVIEPTYYARFPEAKP